MDIANLIQTVLIYALPVLFAITVHEAAHGYVAHHYGDNTAHRLGRITLNPLKHIDPIGTILVPLLMYVFTPFMFGYAKPVPVNFGKLRNPKRDMIWVALAGPAANFVQAFLWLVLSTVLEGAGVTEPFFIKMCVAGVSINLMMFAFNLFPIPPLDGGRILVGLLPYRQAVMVSRIEPFGFFIVLALLTTPIISNLWMRPMLKIAFGVLDILRTPFVVLFN